FAARLPQYWQSAESILAVRHSCAGWRARIRTWNRGSKGPCVTVTPRAIVVPPKQFGAHAERSARKYTTEASGLVALGWPAAARDRELWPRGKYLTLPYHATGNRLTLP